MNQIRDDLDSALVDLDRVIADIDRLTSTCSRMEAELIDLSLELDRSTASLRAMLRNAPRQDEQTDRRDGIPESTPAGELSQLEREWAGLLQESTRST